jgi:hypothetical protein
MPSPIHRLVQRDRVVVTRVSSRELERLHRAARGAGLTLADLAREAMRSYARELERDRRDHEARS